MRSNKCLKVFQSMKIYEKFSVKMGGLGGSKIGRAGGGAQYTLFKLVYILEESVAN